MWPAIWRWGESNPRPRARTASLYRFIRPIVLSRRGPRTCAHSLPYPGVCPPAPPGRNRGEPRSVTSPPTARGGAAGNPSSTLLTQRERDCRCCWQLMVCRIRRSAAPPATCDPDRSGRDRCTPGRTLSYRTIPRRIALKAYSFDNLPVKEARARSRRRLGQSLLRRR